MTGEEEFELIGKVFEAIKTEMRENYEDSKEYLDKCAQRVEQINKFVADKKQEYQETLGNEKAFEKTLENLGKGE